MSAKQIQLEKFTILDGKCHVFQRDGSPFWWCGFHFKGKFLRSSTKESTRAGAEAVARLWYFRKQNEIANGGISNSKETFGKIRVLAVENYKGLVARGAKSKVTLKGIESILQSRVSPYFDNVPVANIDNAKWHAYKTHILSLYPNATRGTLHQYKNAIRVVLNEAYRRGIIKQLPVFKDEYQTRKIGNARPWFTIEEYKKLKKALVEHAKNLSTKDKRQCRHAIELYCYVVFGVLTGMRVGELNNMRFCDVAITTEKQSGKEILVISNIKGKRGTGICQSYYGLPKIFRQLLNLRRVQNTSTENVFLIHHRVMFNSILAKTGLKMSKGNPPAKRDFVSLRATYICCRLLAGVPIYEIANNCRTSVAMIEQSYARQLGGQLMPNINRELEQLDDLLSI